MMLYVSYVKNTLRLRAVTNNSITIYTIKYNINVFLKLMKYQNLCFITFTVCIYIHTECNI